MKMGNKKWFLPLPAAWPSSEDQWMHCAQSQPEQNPTQIFGHGFVYEVQVTKKKSFD